MITISNMLKQTRLSEMKTDFINNMAHELKTPLTTISIASSTLSESKKKLAPGKIRGLSEMISDQNKQLSKLIDHILDINLWEKDQISLQKKEVDLAELIRSRAEAFRVENANITFSLTEEVKLNGTKAEIDEFQFTIALHNLLSNALKYGGEPPVIQLDAGFEIDHVYVKVKDNGKGIRYDEQTQIFSKFYRGKDGGTRKGLGLGLFYVKEIVELHGGTVEVFSKLGHGSTFVIRLPIKSLQRS
jgi:two-component system phosphate regulon sensor histidine kinase PhoR